MSPETSRELKQRAFRHGMDARDRFADRPFHEVENWLRESWEAASDADWSSVVTLVRGGYEDDPLTLEL